MTVQQRESSRGPTVFIVDDDAGIRDALTLLLECEGINAESYPSAESFLENYCPEQPGCLILDLDMPGLDGLGLQAKLGDRQVHIPIIFLTGKADVPMTLQAFRAGAVDLLQKPASNTQLLALIRNALASELQRWSVGQRFQQLTPREQEVFWLLTDGMSSKMMARQLDISHRTIEGHRFRIMEKMQASSLAELIGMVSALSNSDES